jgi:transposase-like protein
MGSAVRDGISRTDAARIGDMDRQTLRDWVHRFRGGDLVADAPLDHLIGSRKDRPWDREVQCPRGPEVDDQAVARWRLHRQVLQRCTAEDAVNVPGSLRREENVNWGRFAPGGGSSIMDWHCANIDQYIDFLNDPHLSHQCVRKCTRNTRGK